MERHKKIDRTSVEDILALTPMQEGMLFHYLREPDSELYFEQLSIRLSGEVNADVLKQAWQTVAQTNEMLRTVFRWGEVEKPIQVVLKTLEIPVKEYDYSGCPEEEWEGILDKIKQEDRKEKMDIAVCPLRITLCKWHNNLYEMIISNHHILYDGWSNGILLKELMATYDALSKGEEPKKVPKKKYKEFVKWYQSQDKNKQKDFWSSYLEGFDTKTLLPSDSKGKGGIQSNHSIQYRLEPEMAEKIKRFTRENQITEATLLYGAWGLVLQAYNRADDVVFGTTVSGRTPEIKGIEDIVGLFINTLPLRIQSIPSETALDFLKRVEKNMMEREEFEGTPLVDIKAYSQMEGQDQIFDSIVVIENYPLDRGLTEHQGMLKVEKYSMFETTNFDITLVISTFDSIEINLNFNSRVFHFETVQRMLKHYVNALNGILGHQNQKLSQLDILSEDEKRLLLFEFNRTKKDYPKYRSIHAMFEEWVQKTPEQTALIFQGEKLSYSELNKKANQTAWYLRERGVVENSIVGVMVERSFEMIIGIMAVLKAGATYVPIDPDYPKERISYLLRNSNTAWVVTQKKFKSHVAEDKAEVIAIDEILSGSTMPEENLDLPYDPERLLYVLYTSGSTGNPKGVMVKSHAFVNLLHWFTTEFCIDSSSCILLMAPTSFDLAQKNLFSSLIQGGTLCLFRPGLYDYNEMSETINLHHVDMINCSPSAFYPLVDFNTHSDFIRLKSLKKVFLGGEPINLNKLMPWIESPHYHGEIINTYGPTECTDISSFYRIDNQKIKTMDTIPIGKTIDNVQVYIMNENLNLLPVGIAGELCIGGVSLAAGYYHAPELTRERFVDCPHVPGGKVYKTGDRAKWLPDGNVEFLGRMDFQVKIRGIRIELGEIEAQILSHPGIQEAVVVDKQDKIGNTYLCAYLVGSEDIGQDELKGDLSGKLPEYMIPKHFVLLKKMPLTPNGKIDRRSLPDPVFTVDSEEHFSLPENEVETDLVEIWQKILDIDRIGVNSNFFDLGGNSILLIQMQAKIEKKYPGKITVTDLFANPTISKLASLIEGNQNKNQRKVPVEYVSLPEAFFLHPNTNQDASMFKFQIKDELYEGIKAVSINEKVGIQDILLAMYAYLWTQISETPRITVQAAPEGGDTAIPLKIDLETMDGFTGLFQYVHSTCLEAKETYNIKDLIHSESERNERSILPLYYAKCGESKGIRLLDGYDIILHLEGENQQLDFTCEFNARHLLREKVKELLNDYIDLLNLLTDKYQFKKELSKNE